MAFDRINANGEFLVGVPIGGIIMWSGTTLPNSDWAICDGNNGTPNLVDKFIKGSSADLSDVGSTGGSKDAVVVEHNHTFTGELLPEHKHVMEGIWSFSTPTGHNVAGSEALHADQTTKDTASASAGTPSGSISTDGEDGAGKNEPPFFVLAYIMRIA